MRKHIKKTQKTQKTQKTKRNKNVNKNTKKYIGGDPRSESLKKAYNIMNNILTDLVNSENSIENVDYWLNDYLLNENPDDTEIKELRDLLIITDQNITKVYNDLARITGQ